MQDQGTPNSQFGDRPPLYYKKPKKRSSWWIPLLIIGVIIAMVVVFGIVVLSVVGSKFEEEKVEIKQNSILHLTLTGISESPVYSPISFLTQAPDRASFLEALQSIKRAKNDPKIAGIFYEGKVFSGLGAAKAAEIREALIDFKQSKKFIYAFIEAGNENTYYNALPADKIFMPQEGMMEMNGFGISTVFLKGLFNKLGVDFYVQQFEDFKSAGETMSRKNFSDSARKELRVMLERRSDEFVKCVAQSRKLNDEDVREIMSIGAYSADEMKYYGLIDEIMSLESVKDFMKRTVFGKADAKEKLSLVSLNKYAADRSYDDTKDVVPGKAIAIINAVGEIGSGSTSGYSNESKIASKDFIDNLRKAREDKEVKAIIIRIDSPGGSVIASDEMWEEIIKTKAVKPVYASMSDVAASGGYYMAMACDTIIAHPMTITGSIGVILMIPNFSGTISKLDLGVDTVSTSPNANFLNGLMPYKEADKKRLHDLSFKIYERFINKAAKSRHKTFDEMRAVAKGRVWMGSDAYEHGLVDVLGGLEDAIKIAKRRIGVKENQKVIVDIYPKKEDAVKSLLKIFGYGNDQEGGDEMKSLAQALGMTPADFMKEWVALPDELQSQIKYAVSLTKLSKQEKAMYVIPYQIYMR